MLWLVMGEAVRLGHTDANPLIRLKLRRERAAKKPELTDEEMVEIREALKSEPEWMQVAFEIGLHTGYRLRETRVPLSCVNFGERKITFPTPKGGEDKAFSIPMPTAINPLLGLPQGDPGAYTLLADGIWQFGHDVPSDLRELWRRLVFSLLASNYDDHLRNHGFLMREPGRWSLSPAYDINPVPEMDRIRMNKTAITEDREDPTIASALAAAPRFGLKATEPKKILGEAFTAVSGWRKTGRQLRLKASTLDTYASAFEHPLMDEARRLLGKS